MLGYKRTVSEMQEEDNSRETACKNSRGNKQFTDFYSDPDGNSIFLAVYIGYHFLFVRRRIATIGHPTC